MLSFATILILQSQLQPDFALPIEPAPILLVQTKLKGTNSVLGIDTGSFDFLLKPSAAGSIGQGQTSLNIPFLSSSPVTARVANFPSAVDGVVGLHFLRKKAIGIDKENGILSVWSRGSLSQGQIDFWFSNDPDKAKHDWKPSETIPYTVHDLHESGDGHYAIHVNVNGKLLEFGLDTDAGITGVDAGGVNESGFSPIGETHFVGLDRNWPVKIGVVDRLSLGTQTWEAFPMAVTLQDPLKHVDGILGFGIFQNRRAIIDLAGYKLYLGAANENPQGDEVLLPYGIRLTPLVKGKQYIAVVPGSTAALAGLRTGDEILMVEGQPVSAANFSRTGTTLPLDISNKVLPTSLTLKIRGTTGDSATRTLTLATSTLLKSGQFSLR
jgi:hypothetical protein